MNRNLHLTWLLLGCIASTQVSAQSTAAMAASGPKTRAEVKAETAAAIKKGELKSSEGGSLENAPPAVAKKVKPKKTKPASSAM